MKRLSVLYLFVSVPWRNSEFHLVLGERVTFAAVSPHVYLLVMHTNAVLPATPAAAVRLRSYFLDPT